MPHSEGTVVRLDRGFPLVKCDSGELVRCEHSTALKKGARADGDDETRAVVGDRVSVSLPEGHDKGVISSVLPRRTAFVRRDPAERTAAQVLAANFDLVIVAEPLVGLNRSRLERELVLAHETGADVAVVLTKSDLAESPDEALAVAQEVRDLAGHSVEVLVVTVDDMASIERVRALVPKGHVAILIGKSGVGKSSLVNLLAGATVQDVGEVREHDGKGRHTTVDRVMVELPDGGCIVDMPGVRGLGMWDADTGLGLAFPDVEALAEQCRFRDCKHSDEPGCAVRAAVDAGELAAARVASWRTLSAEIESVRERREEARRARGEKASDRRKKPRGPRKR